MSETDGRRIFRRLTLDTRWGKFEYRSDLIARDYMRRWVIFTPWGAARLHCILRGDDRAALHDHPMDFKSLILRGGYIEHTPDRPPRRFLPGDVVVKRAEDLHALELIDGPAWTLVLAGPLRREWGFMTPDEGWIPASEYDAWRARTSSRKGSER